MTVCEKCRRDMTIRRVLVDIGNGNEEFEFEACWWCRIVYVSSYDWSVES